MSEDFAKQLKAISQRKDIDPITRSMLSEEIQIKMGAEPDAYARHLSAQARHGVGFYTQGEISAKYAGEYAAQEAAARKSFDNAQEQGREQAGREYQANLEAAKVEQPNPEPIYVDPPSMSQGRDQER